MAYQSGQSDSEPEHLQRQHLRIFRYRTAPDRLRHRDKHRTLHKHIPTHLKKYMVPAEKSAYLLNITSLLIATRRGVPIEIRTVYHTTYITRPHPVNPGEKFIPILIRQVRVPGNGLIIRIPFSSVSDIIIIDDLFCHLQNNVSSPTGGQKKKRHQHTH